MTKRNIASMWNGKRGSDTNGTNRTDRTNKTNLHVRPISPIGPIRGNQKDHHMPDTIDPRWAWRPYQPSVDNLWDLKKAGHLYRRAAFGATSDELHAAVKDGPKRTIDRLLLAGTPAAGEDPGLTLRDSRHNIAHPKASCRRRILKGPP